MWAFTKILEPLKKKIGAGSSIVSLRLLKLDEQDYDVSGNGKFYFVY